MSRRVTEPKGNGFRPLQPIKNRAGFSLVEMMVAISIGSIVFGIVNKAIQLLVLRAAERSNGGVSTGGLSTSLLPQSMEFLRKSQVEMFAQVASAELARRDAGGASISGAE